MQMHPLFCCQSCWRRLRKVLVAGNERAHSQLAERQQNSRLRRSNIAAVSPLALLISLIIAPAPADMLRRHPQLRQLRQQRFLCLRNKEHTWKFRK